MRRNRGECNLFVFPLSLINVHIIAVYFIWVCRQAFVSRDVILQTKSYRTRHIRTILAAQARQRISKIKNEEELSRLSQESSAQVCARAGKIATVYWKVLK